MALLPSYTSNASNKGTVYLSGCFFIYLNNNEVNITFINLYTYLRVDAFCQPRTLYYSVRKRTIIRYELRRMGKKICWSLSRWYSSILSQGAQNNTRIRSLHGRSPTEVSAPLKTQHNVTIRVCFWHSCSSDLGDWNFSDWRLWGLLSNYQSSTWLRCRHQLPVGCSSSTALEYN
jgi:hypothetical protein